MLDKPHPNAPRADRQPRERPLPIIPWDKIKLGEGARYLIKKLIPSAGLIVVYGPPKCGKTFWIFDALMHIALGWDYRGRRVRQGAVVYCLFEGQENFGARKEAFEQKFLSEYEDKIPFYLMAVKIELVKDHPRLIAAIKAALGGETPAIVNLDTLNRSFTGSESSDEAMTAYVNACDAIREALHCAVAIVHHTGLDTSRYRGHTSLLGAADAQISVKRDAAENVVATLEFMKDGPDGEEIVSRLEVVDVGLDEDGDPITSCIVVPVEGGSARPTRTIKRNRRDKTFDEAFDEIAYRGTISHHVNRDGPLIDAVLVEQVETEFKRRYVCDKGDAKQQTANRKKQWQAAIDAAIGKRDYAAEVTKDARQLLWKTL